MLRHQLSPARFAALLKSADSGGRLHQLLQLKIESVQREASSAVQVYTMFRFKGHSEAASDALKEGPWPSRPWKSVTRGCFGCFGRLASTRRVESVCTTGTAQRNPASGKIYRLGASPGAPVVTCAARNATISNKYGVTGGRAFAGPPSLKLNFKGTRSVLMS
jgi:hypothetical protein